MVSCLLASFVPTAANNNVEVEGREAACHSVGTCLEGLGNFKPPDKEEKVVFLLRLLATTA
jgi:hypothetical protein